MYYSKHFLQGGKVHQSDESFLPSSLLVSSGGTRTFVSASVLSTVPPIPAPGTVDAGGLWRVFADSDLTRNAAFVGKRGVRQRRKALGTPTNMPAH